MNGKVVVIVWQIIWILVLHIVHMVVVVIVVAKLVILWMNLVVQLVSPTDMKNFKLTDRVIVRTIITEVQVIVLVVMFLAKCVLGQLQIVVKSVIMT